MTDNELERRVAAAIALGADDDDGMGQLVAAVEAAPGHFRSVLGVVRSHGIPWVSHDAVTADGRLRRIDGLGLYPSRARCAELALTASGDRRERLLRGMLIDG